MKKFRATIAFLLCCTLFLYGTTSLVFAAEITTTSHLSKANLIDNIAHNDMSISTEDLSEAQALIDRGACSALLPFSDIVSK